MAKFHVLTAVVGKYVLFLFFSVVKESVSLVHGTAVAGQVSALVDGL